MRIQKSRFLSFLMAISFAFSAHAGGVTDGKLPEITIGAGLMYYKGDLAFINEVGNVYNPTLGYELSLSYNLWKTLGVELFGSYASISQEQRTSTFLHNFKTDIYSGGLNLYYRFDNDYLMKSTGKLAPFIMAGIAPIAFFPYGDVQDADGNTYNYWSDGSIRNIAEDAPNAREAVEIEKDYEYELSYRGLNQVPMINYAINVGAGSRFYLNKWLSAQLRLTYSFTGTDYLDGIEVGSTGKDGYFFGSLGLVINPNKISFKKSEDEENFDVSEFLAIDSDGDGIPDVEDLCPNSTEGATVNKHGCVEGEELASTDKDSLSMFPDSMTVLRNKICMNYPPLCYSDESEYIKLDGTYDISIYEKKEEQKALEEQVSMSKIIKIADRDKDGQVELPEVYYAIERFFDEGKGLTLPELRKLIEFFFDQF